MLQLCRVDLLTINSDDYEATRGFLAMQTHSTI